MLAFIYDARLQVSKFGHVVKAKLQGIVLSFSSSSFFRLFDVSSVSPSSRFSATLSITLHEGQSSNSLDKIKSVNVSRNLFCNAKPKLWKGCKNLKIALCDRPVQGIRGAWQITWGLSSSSIRNVTHAYQGDYQSRGALNQVLYGGGSAPRSTPSAFYIPFLREKVPLSCTFYCTFPKTKFKMLNPLNCCKCTVT